MSEQPIPWEQVVPRAHNLSPQSMTRDALLKMFFAGQKPGRDFLLVDVRREDHEVQLRFPTNTIVVSRLRADDFAAGV